MTKILFELIQEWQSGAGTGIVVPGILKMLRQGDEVWGDSYFRPRDMLESIIDHCQRMLKTLDRLEQR